ncbi:MAG: sulfotransferase [Planctomycetota bacterium]
MALATESIAGFQSSVRAEQYLEIQYEELLLHPRNVLARVWEFLQIPVDETA